MPYPYDNFNNNPFLRQNSPVAPQMYYGQPNTQAIQNNGYQGQNNSFQPNMNVPQAQALVSSPNKIYVTNLQDALSRFSNPNTNIIYTTQDEKYEIEVFTDMQGKKTYQAFERKPYVQDDKPQTNETTNYATKDDIANFEKMLNDKLAEFNKAITETRNSVNGFNMPDMRNYATLSDINTLKEDLTSSVNSLKSKINSIGGKRNAE